jgi:mRNA interferase MazF
MGWLKRGWVVLASYPFTDLTAVSRRPALVVSASDRPGDDCILAFITSRTTNVEATDLLLEMSDPDFASTGLRVSSMVRCGKLMTLNHRLLVGRIGHLSGRLMIEVNTRLRVALEL